MASRVAPMTAEPPVRQRRPRITDERHLAFVRICPCAISGARPVDPAHLRAGNRLLGKRSVGLAEKPDDRWTVPLSRALHDVQHSMGELEFWESYGIINPWQLALALFAASSAGDLELAEAILGEHRRLAAGWR